MANKPSEINVRPWCPFCGQVVEKPLERERRKMGEFPVGDCQCGAVYASDASGWNVGAAMIEAMVYACNDDWDLTWELDPDDDYLTERLEPYDEASNQVVETGNIDGRKIKGVLYFVRLQGDVKAIAERVKSNGPLPVSASYIPKIEPERDKKRTRKKAKKNDIKDLVEKLDIDALVDLTFDDIKTIRFMQRLLYSMDDSLRWKNIYAMGEVCARYSTRHPGKVSDLLHRLFAASGDSASTPWGMIEATGAIIAARPDIFGAFSHHLLNFLEDPSTQVATLWSLANIARNRPDLIRKMPFYHLFKMLGFADPLIKAHALRLFGRIKAVEAKSKIEDLAKEMTIITIYEDGEPHLVSIAQLAQDALELIEAELESNEGE